jgi:hypothetical protein
VGQHKKSNHLRAVDGTDKRNKDRHNADEPDVPENPSDSGGIGDPPAGMKKAEVVIWWEFVDNHYAGCLGSGDRFALEVVCQLMYRKRKGHLKKVEPKKAGELTQ